MNHSTCFSQTYAEARAKFLSAAQRIGMPVQSHIHPLKGREDEALAMDVARHGALDAQALLVLTSGCHGIEGYAGSGVQIALLNDATFLERANKAGVAVLFVHGVNPWGFSWWERWTHENVDQNRNFIDFSNPAARPVNRGYDELAAAIVPETWPAPEADATLWAYAAKHGLSAIQSAIADGQYSHPGGLFYGGDAPTWSNRTVRAVLREHGTRCARLGWIDLHTAAGAWGACELIAPPLKDSAASTRARAWWGERVGALGDESGLLSALNGVMLLAAADECPLAEVTGVIAEFGTVVPEETVMALRGNQWLKNHPEADANTRDAIKQRMRKAFCDDSDDWMTRTAAHGVQAAHQALAGLATEQ